MIAVVSYGVSNVGSILNMFRKIGAPAEAVSTPAEVARAEKVVLPGIGAFDNGMKALVDLGLAEPLTHRVVNDGVPILGICLGMQLLGRGSEEGAGGGLSLLEGRCVRFRGGNPPLKVPHMGWAELLPRRDCSILTGLDGHARFYFVHSYHLACDDPADVVATARYHGEFTAMVQRNNVWGVQFHPEKSHRYGMTLLGNFARL